jgi:hypothetical protein
MLRSAERTLRSAERILHSPCAAVRERAFQPAPAPFSHAPRPPAPPPADLSERARRQMRRGWAPVGQRGYCGMSLLHSLTVGGLFHARLVRNTYSVPAPSSATDVQLCAFAVGPSSATRYQLGTFTARPSESRKDTLRNRGSLEEHLSPPTFPGHFQKSFSGRRLRRFVYFFWGFPAFPISGWGCGQVGWPTCSVASSSIPEPVAHHSADAISVKERTT